jgi:hypothetical protein
VEKFFDALLGLVKDLLAQLLLNNPTAAAWAIAFFVLLFASVRLLLHARGLQEKYDGTAQLREDALKEQQARHDEKINNKDREIQSLNDKFHQQSNMNAEAMQAIKDALLRTNVRPHVLNLHNGVLALCISAGIKPHEAGMQTIGHE